MSKTTMQLEVAGKSNKRTTKQVKSKPVPISLINPGMTDREAAKALEVYDYDMSPEGPIFYTHDTERFVVELYRLTNEQLPTHVRLEKDFLGGATLWLPGMVSVYDGLQMVDAAANQVDRLALMRACRTGEE